MSAITSNEEAISTLVSMGFEREAAQIALARCQNDVNLAVHLLSGGDFSAEGDGEFDLIAEAEPQPLVQPPTVFQPRVGGHDGTDHFAEDVREGTTAELLDARIAYFTDMGFTSAQAEDALRRCNDDVNEALTYLLESVGN
jgi:uncharacterized UBP type Zn finger protein